MKLFIFSLYNQRRKWLLQMAVTDIRWNTADRPILPSLRGNASVPELRFRQNAPHQNLRSAYNRLPEVLQHGNPVWLPV